MESLLGVAEGDYTFDLEAVVAEALAQWPGSEFARATGQLATITLGQLQLPGGRDGRGLEVSVLLGGGGFGLDGDETVAADYIAWLTSRPGFPDDRSVMLTDWAIDLLPLHANMTAGDLMAAVE